MNSIPHSALPIPHSPSHSSSIPHGVHPPRRALPIPHSPSLPYWIPAGVQLERFPPEIAPAIAEVINPAYQQLVLSAQPGLAQSTGLTIVHLLWLEILDHLQLAEQPPPWGLLDLHLPIKGSRESLIDRHLRLVGAKFKASDLLLRLKAFKSQGPLGGLPRSLHVYDHVDPSDPEPPKSC